MYYCVQDRETEEGIFTANYKKAMEYMIRLRIQYGITFTEPFIANGIEWFFFKD